MRRRSVAPSIGVVPVFSTMTLTVVPEPFVTVAGALLVTHIRTVPASTVVARVVAATPELKGSAAALAAGARPRSARRQTRAATSARAGAERVIWGPEPINVR